VNTLAGMNISFVAGTLGQGGAERQLYYNVKALRESGAAVTVLCLTTGEFWESRLAALGARVVWVGQSRNRVALLLRIVRELRAARPDLVQSQHLYTNLYVVAAARILRLPEVGAIRNDSPPEVQACGRVMGRLSLRAPRVVAANSMTAIRSALRTGLRRGPFRFLPNVVDTNEFRPMPRSDQRPFTVVFVGRLVRQKRVDRFLSVLAEVVRRSTMPISAMIVGSGPERTRIEEQARSLGLLPGVVTLREAVGDAAPIYASADLLVNTSDFEGTPNVVLEAMSCGLPIVATPCGDVPEIVRHGESGYVVDAGDEEAMVQLILGLAGNTALRAEMGRAARAHIEATRSLERLPATLREFYSAVPVH
jgi:glycosyltransferase involved in cell wall biosynthesis